MTKEEILSDESNLRIITEFFSKNEKKDQLKPGSSNTFSPRMKKAYQATPISASLPRIVRAPAPPRLIKAPPPPPRTSLPPQAPHKPPLPAKKPLSKQSSQNATINDLSLSKQSSLSNSNNNLSISKQSSLSNSNNSLSLPQTISKEEIKTKKEIDKSTIRIKQTNGIKNENIDEKSAPHTPDKKEEDKKGKESNHENEKSIKKINENQKGKEKEKENKKGDLVIALFDFKGSNTDELEFQRGDYLRVTNWGFEESWAYGYLSNKQQKKGAFPKSYIRVCDNEKKEHYLMKLKELIKNDNIKEDEIIGEDYYEWVIKDWNKLEDEEYCPEFTAGNHRWKILLCPNGDCEEEKDYVSIYLYCLDVENEKFPENSHICANFIFSIRNYNDYSSYNSKKSPNLDYFGKNNNGIGYTQFIKKSELQLKNEKYNTPIIENGKTVIGAYIRVYNKGDEDSSILKNKRQPLPKKISTKELPSRSLDSLSSAPPKLHDNRKSPLDNNGRQTPITAPVAYIPQEDGDLVIALYNFKGTKSDELDFHKGEYLRVTNWNFESDWVFGYKSGNKNKKGSFPKTYISICNDKKDGVPFTSSKLTSSNSIPLLKPYLTSNGDNEFNTMMMNEPMSSNKNEPTQLNSAYPLQNGQFPSQAPNGYQYIYVIPQYSNQFPPPPMPQYYNPKFSEPSMTFHSPEPSNNNK
jgi:hypothetical protein